MSAVGHCPDAYKQAAICAIVGLGRGKALESALVASPVSTAHGQRQ